MEATGFTIIGLGILAFGLVSGRAERISPAMAFVLFGYIAGSGGFGFLSLESGNEMVHLVAELALIVILFTDASRIDLRLLWKDHDIPVRLLAFGLPLTIVAGALVAGLIFDVLTPWEALLLGIVLAPTDAALGQAVVSNPGVPVRIRQGLNIESGLNDGIALPFLLGALAIAGSATAAQEEATGWILFAARQVGLGPLVGIAVGFAGSKLLQKSYHSGWTNIVFLKLSAVGLALLAYGLAGIVHGNGFIAAFAAGLIMGNVARDICPSLHMFGEAEGQLLALITFLIFGGLMLPEALGSFSWQMVLYALLSLTLIRMVPVWISLAGMKMMRSTTLFLGWFGPRGIASILYVLLIIDASDLPGLGIIRPTVILTVLLSVFLHGVTANPIAAAYARGVESMEEEMPEDKEVGEMPLRLGTPAK